MTLGSEEQFLIRTEGGPYPGTRVSDGPWPLPDELTAPTGRYVKVSESQLKEGSPHLLRGALRLAVLARAQRQRDGCNDGHQQQD